MMFKGKTALVTGGSSGIGLATARALANRGAHVWLLARREPELQAALADVRAACVNSEQVCGTLSVDVSDQDAVFPAVEKIIATAGVPDLVINAAGAARPGYVQDLELETFQWMMDVNYFGPVYVAKAVLPGMLARESGYIVNISSMAGLIGVFGYTAYSAAKFALRGFSDALRAELKPLGIHVSIVFPPNTDTPGLAYENRFKPYETSALESVGGEMSPERVAGEILRGVERGQYMILPGVESKLTYSLAHLAGKGVYPVIDFLIGRARRSKNGSNEI
jgi:3-dehydrosphinganine reductase